jgi:putative ABC transport system permease protein
VQTTVIGLVLLVSTATSVLALALVADSNAPFDHAFAADHGADAVVTIDSSRATSAQLASTSRLPQVTSAAGPFSMVSATLQMTLPASSGQQGPGPPPPGNLPPALTSMTGTVAGRASPGGPVDDLTLTEGHWAQRPGQIVLSGHGPAGAQGISPALGSKLIVATAPGEPELTVVGYVTSITGTAGAWVVPAQLSALRAPGIPGTAQMLYRFASASSEGQIQADVAAVTAALPAGAVTGTQSYLAARLTEAGDIAPFVPFLAAFGIIGIVMSVLIVANVVSVPAVAGCLGGVLLRNLLAVPVLGTTANVYAVGTLGVPAWVDATVPAAMVCLVVIAATAPALRAGRLSAVQAIAAGPAPRTGRGCAAHRFGCTTSGCSRRSG